MPMLYISVHERELLSRLLVGQAEVLHKRDVELSAFLCSEQPVQCPTARDNAHNEVVRLARILRDIELLQEKVRSA